MKIILQPSVLRWARERAGLDAAALAKKLSARQDQVEQWERDGVITYKRAEAVAHKTHTPFGYFFLEEPPEEKLPISDLRTVGSEAPPRPTPELLDVLYDAMRKQGWYRDHLVDLGEERREFVGSARLEEDPVALARRIRADFQLESAIRSEAGGWQEALSLMIERMEEKGVLVLRSGVADGNPHRPLRVSEFRGFALTDPYAPVIFVNSRDSQAAQMFTLVHELIHLWLGLSGVSNLQETYAPGKRVELFCNKVAAEILVPLEELSERYAQADAADDPVFYLVRHFKVSSLVILRRLHDLKKIDWNTFRKLYREQEEMFRAKKARHKGGGNYYATQTVRAGRRFSRAVVGSALDGRTPYRDAYGLLGIRKAETFKEFAQNFILTSDAVSPRYEYPHPGEE